MTSPERPRTGLIPFLSIPDGRAVEALAFYAAAFGAEEVERNVAPDGRRLMQASMKINGAWIMLADEFPEWSGRSSVQAAGVVLHLPVEDADAAWARALAAGASVAHAIADQFWGDRYGQLRDPFGQTWAVASPLKPAA